MKHFPILQGRAYVVELPEGHQQAFEALKNGRELTINRKRKSANVDHITFDFDFAEQLFIGGFLACTSGNLDTGDRHYLFGLGWQIVGMLPEITEEQAAGIVDYNEDIRYYRAYGVHPVESGDGKQSQLVGYLDAIKSLESAILAEGWYFENPIGEEPDKKKFGFHEANSFDDYTGWCYEGGEDKYYESLSEWDQAQSRVLDPELTLILERK